MQQRPYILLLLLLSLSLGSCREKNTDDAAEAYKLWADKPATGEVVPVHGRYWQSAHWTKEYKVYLQLKASAAWQMEFVKQHNIGEVKHEVSIPKDAPVWFKPGYSYAQYTKHGDLDNAGYFLDTAHGSMFFYELQF